MTRRFFPLILAVLVLAACSPEEAELTTTTTTAPTESISTIADETTTTTEGTDDSEPDEEAGPAITDHEIVVRSSSTAGETLWILIDPGDYSDIDLENLIRQMVDESDVTLAGINVFDDLAALEAGRVDVDARTEDEQALVDEHFLVSLVDSAIIRFEGPYAEFGETAVGS
jgi:hypothetical protein